MDNEAQLRGTINAAIRNNVAFFPIDARGLVAAAPLGDATKASPGGSGMYSGSSRARSNPAPRARRRRSTRWPPTPAARRCWITTISPWASCRRRRKSPVTTSWATTAPTTSWTAATAASSYRP